MTSSISYLLISVLVHSCNVFLEKRHVLNPDCQNIGHIELIINNIRNSEGVIQIGMYNSEEGYPDNPPFSYTLPKDSLISGRLRLMIPVSEYGTYAISILDDRNSNKKMDYRLGIIPKEGFGIIPSL